MCCLKYCNAPGLFAKLAPQARGTEMQRALCSQRHPFQPHRNLKPPSQPLGRTTEQLARRRVNRPLPAQALKTTHCQAPRRQLRMPTSGTHGLTPSRSRLPPPL